MNTTAEDSTGKLIKVGDRVRFRGREYLIKGFLPGEGRDGTVAIVFETDVHVLETPDEWSVDLVLSYEGGISENDE